MKFLSGMAAALSPTSSKFGMASDGATGEAAIMGDIGVIMATATIGPDTAAMTTSFQDLSPEH
ncbi:hypothetical protein [Mesorhizobium sp. WSM4312]|uniref:hypothetical protein n=1 Tax=Mesorhizobium sp. WSM4312 TaxID=2029411 RepID=UPI00117D9280|nr:hypothetical protein [Mesorhizobium sp. WSM4312]